MDTYNRRIWLNGLESSSTSSIVTFDGDVKYSDKTYRDTFVRISDCTHSIKLHKKDEETVDEFTKKLSLLKDELELFINHLNKHTL